MIFMTSVMAEIPTEIVCALITCAGIILSNWSSRAIAKDAAKKEAERIKQEWQHDEQIALNNAFHDMAHAVSAYISDSSVTKQLEARTKTAVMLTYADGELADKVEALYDCLKCRPALDADEKLHDAVLSLRQIRAADGNKERFLSFCCRASR